MTEIDFPNLSALQSAIAALPRLLQEALADAGPTVLLQLIPDLARYPSPPAGSTYARTGTLGRLWTSAQPVWSASGSGLGFAATLANATPYGPYVQDPGSQPPWMDHWDDTQAILDQHTAELAAALADALAARLEGFRA